MRSVTSTQITFLAPAGAAGAVAVTVTTPAGSGVKTAGYTYVTPSAATTNPTTPTIPSTAPPAVAPGSTAALPAAPSGGTSVLLVAGQSTPVTVTRNSATKAADVSGPGFTMRLYGQSPDGGALGFSNSGALVIEQDRQVRIEGTGFQPNSLVSVYMFSTPTALGTVTTDIYGNFSGAVPVPTSVAPGSHTVQVNGYATSGQVRSLSMAAELRSDMRTSKATAVFKGKSVKLTDKAKKRLNALVQRTKATATQTVVVGSVGPGAKNATPLARARMAAVISYLQSRGLAGEIITKPYGGAVLKKGISAKRTTVTVTF
jgi:hypothetical protein